MIKSYLTIAYRNLLKNKVLSLINIWGLAIGMAACLLILQYVSFELSYDDFHKKSEQIFRVAMDQYKRGALEIKSATTFPVVGSALQENFPEIVEVYVRLHQQSAIFSYEDDHEKKIFDEKKVFYTDASFFEVFTFPLLIGNAVHAFTNPNAVVITASIAEKYFGSTWREKHIIGKTIQSKSYYGETDLSIVGVIADPPENSHLQFNLLISYPTIYNWNDGETNYREESENAWFWEYFYTYVVLKRGADPQKLEKAFEPIVDQNTTYQREEGFLYRFNFQPIEKIHLHSHLMRELEVNGDAQQVYILLVIAICILVIAWVNFVNLSTTKAIERAKEVGMRKVLGASRKQLIVQYLLEASFLNMAGLLIAITFFQVSLPYFKHFTGITQNLKLFMQADNIFYISTCFLAGILLSGIYPAFVLSAYQPIKVLKGKLIRSRSGGWLKKGLVVSQFSIAALLIMIVFTIHRQLYFMKNHELGMDIEQKLVIEGAKFVNSIEEYRDNIYAYKNALKSYNMVQHVTVSRNVPATEIRGNNYVYRLDKPEENKFFHVMGVDYDYMATFDLQLLAGKFFDEDHPVNNVEIIEANRDAPDFGTNDHAIIINETAARLLGFQQIEDAINQQIAVFGGVKEIVGVVKDYHHKSLRNNFEPIIFYLQPTGWEYITLDVKITHHAPDQFAEVINYAENAWKQIYPDEPFNYFFLDDFFNQQYKADQQFYVLFNLFTGLAIFIACLGLFGLSAYTAIQRTKEVSIRKVLGASVQSIVALLSKDLIVLICVASTIALPIAYFAIQQWLKNYAFRIELSWWMFTIPMIMILCIAVVTVSFQTIKAALTNPVDSLRSE